MHFVFLNKSCKNYIDIFPDKLRTYEIPQTKQFVHHELIRIANYSFLSTLSCNTLLFISAAVRYYKEATWNGDNNFLKIKKHITSVFQFEKPFDFQMSKFSESQTLPSFLQAGYFILAENIKQV